MARTQPLRGADLCANSGKLSESEPSQHNLYFRLSPYRDIPNETELTAAEVNILTFNP